MKTHVTLLTRDWSAYAKEEDYEKLKNAMINKTVVEFTDLFGAPTTLDGAKLVFVFISSERERALYHEFGKMKEAEEEEAEPSWK